MNATPETFKPGERWLMAGVHGMAIEVVCVEWSPSGDLVKVLIVSNDKADWMRATEKVHGIKSDNPRTRYVIELLERLPDVESGNNQAESPRRIETDSLIRFARLLIVNWPCRCDHCKVQKSKAYTRTEEAEKDLIESAQTKV